MAYPKKFQLLQAQEARNDGSTGVNHDLQGIYSDDEGETWKVIPGGGYHKTVIIPGAELQALAQVGGAAEIVAAYKDLLRTHAQTQATPYLPPDFSGWSNENIEDYILAYEAWQVEFAARNVIASDATAMSNNFITNTLGLEYSMAPGEGVVFSL